VCAASKYGDIIIPSARHHDKVMNDIIKAIGSDKLKPTKDHQGFIDQWGVFMTREEAFIVAKESRDGKRLV